MKIFIVYAHQEPRSFNGAMRDLAFEVLTEAGHAVQVSDLYAMRFKAVADGDDFTERQDPAYFKYAAEQKHAWQSGTLAADIQAEQAKLRWCDLLILQFPFWWFSVPGIMKGWVDRVFTTGFAYDRGVWYDEGGLRGRKAMLALTTGGPPGIYTKNGLNGDIHDILFHINHGMLYFVGFEVLPPFIAFSPGQLDEQDRATLLDEYRHRLLTIERLDPIPFPKLADYDANFQLKPGHGYGGQPRDRA